MSEHTPGPWRVGAGDTNPDNEDWAINANNWLSLAVGFNNDVSPSQGEANARLIAAAPRMYELLKVLVSSRAGHFERETARALLKELDS